MTILPVTSKMSLFADRLPSVFDRQPLCLDRLHSPRLGLYSASRKFADSPKDISPFFPSSMRVHTHGAAAVNRGFYDHFDSVFHHGLAPKRFYGDFSSRRQAAEPRNGGKEYVIPIKIENGSSSSAIKSSTVASPSGHSRGLVDIHGDSTESKCSRAKSPVFGKAKGIEIPIVRGSPSQPKAGASDVPSTFTILTPTTEQALKGVCRPTTKDEDDDEVIYLDEKDFFPSRQSPKNEESLPQLPKDLLSDIDDDCDWKLASDKTPDTKVEQRETFSESLRRKPLRLSTRERKTSATTSERAPEIQTTDVKPSQASVLTSDINDTKSKDSDVRSRRRKGFPESSRCCHPGVKIFTPPPSYPIYDYLQPRLASIERKVDSIQGDGNCLFRAISKDLFGTEDYHIDCREQVCDLIEQYPNVFAQYIDGADVVRHVEQMRQLGTWATTCEIYAVSTLLQREIYVLAPSPSMDTSKPTLDYHWLLFSPRLLTRSGSSSNSDGSSSGQTMSRCYMTLCHTNSNHYDRIAPINAQCNCEIPPPELNGVSILMDLTESEEDDMVQEQ